MNNLHTYYRNKTGLLHKYQDCSIFLHSDDPVPIDKWKDEMLRILWFYIHFLNTLRYVHTGGNVV
jgi:hypothetical protein